jgi:protein EFR3
MQFISSNVRVALTLLLILQVDPHLRLMDDCQLVNTCAESSNSEMVYGSEEDESDALAFLSAINKPDTELIETVMCHFREKFENLPEVWV